MIILIYYIILCKLRIISFLLTSVSYCVSQYIQFLEYIIVWIEKKRFTIYIYVCIKFLCRTTFALCEHSQVNRLGEAH